ncbi:RNA polymerase sigma factor [Sphingobacterium sp. Mn56C]|uniref:RNA polymerase sigma factor n=1 Tax=Sphingobacterium sp. Mn56C TaxID=3395261 RepID=UPI003BDBFCD1
MGNFVVNYVKWSDEELFLGIQAGDYRAFTEVYNRFVEPLFSYSLRIKIDTEDREDAIQEVFSSLWRRREELKIDNLGAWLHMSIRKQALYQIRKKKYSNQYTQSIIDFVSPYYDPILGAIQEKELQAYIDQQLNLLPPRAQEVFRLSRQDHLSHKEIGEKLAISEKTVRKQIQNVLKVFRYKLGRNTVEILVLLAFFK